MTLLVVSLAFLVGTTVGVFCGGLLGTAGKTTAYEEGHADGYDAGLHAGYQQGNETGFRDGCRRSRRTTT